MNRNGSDPMSRVLVLLALVVTGCGAQAGDDARLDLIQHRIREAQVEQRQVESRLERLRCEARVQELSAAATRIRSACDLQHAEHLRCIAANERARSEQSVLGCGLGALITGGAGLLLCGASVALGPSAHCEAHPDCQRSDEDTTNEALQAEGLAEFPNCDANG